MSMSGLESTETKLCDVGQSPRLPRGEVLASPPTPCISREVSKATHTHFLHPHRRSKASERCTTHGLSACRPASWQPAPWSLLPETRWDPARGKVHGIMESLHQRQGIKVTVETS